jgi:hypothetical protein
MTSGIYKRTSFHIKKLSESHKGKKRKTFTKEWCDNISKALTGKKRKPFKESTRRKLSISRKGKNCNFWKGGITPEHLRVKMSIEWKLWREAVFARDNWICQKTGTRGGKLHPHHIKNFSQYPELRFAIDNGITLSEESHKEFHKMYGKENNNREQLNEFLNSEDVVIKHLGGAKK